MTTPGNEYTAWLYARITDWVKQNPAEYKALRASTWEKIKRHGQTMPKKGTFAGDYFNGIVCEAIRRVNKWPSERQYERGVRLVST